MTRALLGPRRRHRAGRAASRRVRAYRARRATAQRKALARQRILASRWTGRPPEGRAVDRQAA